MKMKPSTVTVAPPGALPELVASSWSSAESRQDSSGTCAIFAFLQDEGTGGAFPDSIADCAVFLVNGYTLF